MGWWDLKGLVGPKEAGGTLRGWCDLKGLEKP
jgi:hypothetical protein